MVNNSFDASNIKPSDYLKTLERSIEVVKSFKGKKALTVNESAKVTGFSKPFTRRVFVTLQKMGYMKSENGKFSFTPKIMTFGNVFSGSLEIWDSMVPFLEELSFELKESTSIAILDDTEIIYIERVTVNNIMSETLGKGTRLPAHATSVGKLLLSYLDEEKLEQYFNRASLQAFTDKTIATENELREQLDQIRTNNWVVNKDELEIGLISMASPIYDDHGDVIAAVNCVTHSGRCSVEEAKERYLPELQKTAKKITEKIQTEVI